MNPESPKISPKELPPHWRYQEKNTLGSSHCWAIKIIAGIPSNARVLDIGAGSGVMARALAAHGFTDLTGVEIDSETRSAISPLYRRMLASLQELTVSPGPEQFDLILLLDVVEHVSDPYRFFIEACQYLSPGGAILVSVPNVAHWSVRLPLLFGFWQYSSRGILDRTHLSFFNRRRLRELVSSVPVLSVVKEDVSISPAEFVLPGWLTRSLVFKLFCWGRLIIARVLPGIGAYQLLVHARRGR